MSELPLTPEQEAEAQALFARRKSVFEQEAWQMARVLAGKEDRQALGGTEFELRERVQRLGAQVVENVRRERKKGDRGARSGCPHCPEAARYVSERSKGRVSLLGPVRCERAYYDCAA